MRNTKKATPRQQAAEQQMPLSSKSLTPEELAVCLKTPLSWIYKQTRQRGPGAMPFYKVGKYCRFDLAEVLEWSRERAGREKAPA